MPIIKSAKKRVRVAEKAAIRNSKTKRSLRTALKAFHAAIVNGEKSADVQKTAQKAQSNIDKAAKKGLIHPNKAARQKAQLARNAKNAATAADAPVKSTAKKTAKSTTKKAAAAPKAAKKPAARTTAAKK